MLTNRTLAQINNRPRKVRPPTASGRWRWDADPGGAAVRFEVLPSFAILAVLGGGVLLVLLLYMSQKAKMTISLSYKGNLDEDFAPLLFCEGGSGGSCLIWEDLAPARFGKATECGRGSTFSRAGAGEGRAPPYARHQGRRAFWGIEAGDASIFFFPEGALIYMDDRYDPLPYNSLKVAFSSGRFFEEEDLPDDATVVDRTWRFSRPDGSPDPRYKKDNVEIPIVLYGLLEISTPS